MSHHFSIQENGYIIITMAGVGYTIKVKYPAATVLSDEKLTKLMTLLRGQEEDVLARWCADRAQTASYFVYDGPAGAIV